MKKKFCLIIIIFIMAFAIRSPEGLAQTPVATDSRIRIFLYGENEVFRVFTNYGYQSNVEFSNGEEVVTISIGNAAAWQITPSGNRLFIRAMEESAHTNMTVITNKRVYQFEMVSGDKTDENLTYVVRFYYPDFDYDKPQEMLSSSMISSISPVKTNSKNQNYDPMENYNFEYTLTGPNDIAPLKIFDDGIRTYFQFPNNNLVIPMIISIKDGFQKEMEYRIVGDYVIVDMVAAEFILNHGRSKVSVYNDKITVSQ